MGQSKQPHLAINVGQSKQPHLATLLTNLIPRVSRGENVPSNFRILVMTLTSCSCEVSYAEEMK